VEERGTLSVCTIIWGREIPQGSALADRSRAKSVQFRQDLARLVVLERVVLPVGTVARSSPVRWVVVWPWRVIPS